MDEDDLLDPSGIDTASPLLPVSGDAAEVPAEATPPPEQINITFPVRVEVVGRLSAEEIARVTEAVLAELQAALEDTP